MFLADLRGKDTHKVEKENLLERESEDGGNFASPRADEYARMGSLDNLEIWINAGDPELNPETSVLFSV